MYLGMVSINNCLLAVVFILSIIGFSGCAETSISNLDFCQTDSDCDEDEVCEDGTCVPSGSSDGDFAGDFDMEDWEDKCSPDEPGIPELYAPCQKYVCEKVAPPKCWECNWAADESLDGEDCTSTGGKSGKCNQGECIIIEDGDIDSTDEDTDKQTDGDREIQENDFTNACEDMGGSCVETSTSCPLDSRPASDNLGCGNENKCCIPLSEVDCYSEEGYCIPHPAEASYPPNCAEGFQPAPEDAGCSLFNPDNDEWCCLPVTTECVAEGGRGSMLDRNPTNDQCCPGLTQVSNATPDNSQQCIAVPDGSFYCTKCGNDICGPGENFCRCEDDCAKPGECQEDSDCPPPSCNDINSGCVQFEYHCDSETHNCVASSETSLEENCNFQTGLCEPVTNNMCESEDTGVCIMYGKAMCPDGTLLNQDSLGCEAMCCLEAECLGNDGYCTQWGNGCADGFAPAAGAQGCPGGFSGLCCLRDQNDCTPLGEMAYMPDDTCCEGLDTATYAEISDDGECLYPECSCFVCIVKGDDYCDIANYESECNSEDCEGPQPECISDNDCPEESCQDLLGPDAACEQYSSTCEQNECKDNYETLDGYYCDYDSGQCKPASSLQCEIEGGMCSTVENACPSGYVIAPEQLDCSGSEPICCLPETACQSDDDCEEPWCFGLSGLPNCIQFEYECTQGSCQQTETTVTDSYCNETSGFCAPMNDPACVREGGYCSDVYGCETGYYPSQDNLGCENTICCLPDGNIEWCEDEGGLCIGWGPQCPSGTETDMDLTCEYGQCCVPTSTDTACVTDGGGYCTEPQMECSYNYYEITNPMGCSQPNGKCCLPNDECIEEGEMGSMWQDDLCCEGLRDISNSWPDETGQCIAPPDGSFVCSYCGDDNCGPGENRCNCPDDCFSSTQCQSDEDCPPPRCFDEGDSYCVEAYSYCDYSGQCVNEEEYFEDARCDESNGMCQKNDPLPSCTDDLGGFCLPYFLGCGNDNHEAEGSCSGIMCAGGCICCVPNE